jgi:hypothetical protein
MQWIGWVRLRELVRSEAIALLVFQRSDRPWQLPFAAALASGVPVALGVHLDLTAEGALGAVAGLSFLYLPSTGLHRRIPVIMACAFAMIASYALGLASHVIPGGAIFLVAFVAAGAAVFCKTQNVVPPGPLFMVMAASIAAFSPAQAGNPIANLGYFALGCIWACTVAVAYSGYILRHRAPDAPKSPSRSDLHAAVVDALIMGLFVGVSLAVAAALPLDNEYWVPVSCMAVMQGLTLRASWSRNVHRIVGTVIGIGLTWLLYPLLTTGWMIAVTVMVLAFLIETAVVRHYAFAAIFITPLTIVLAEASSASATSVDTLMVARLTDTVVGALIGLSGAVCLHNRHVRQVAERVLTAIAPSKPSG